MEQQNKAVLLSKPHLRDSESAKGGLNWIDLDSQFPLACLVPAV